MTRREFNEQRLAHLRAMQEKYAASDDEQAQEFAYECKQEADELEHYMGLDSMEQG